MADLRTRAGCVEMRSAIRCRWGAGRWGPAGPRGRVRDPDACIRRRPGRSTGASAVPPRSVATPSSFSLSAIAWRVMPWARITAIRSRSSGRSATEGRPAPAPLARAAASPRRVHSASLRLSICPAAASARTATFPVGVPVSRSRSAATSRLSSPSNQDTSVPTADAEPPRHSRPWMTMHEASPAAICSNTWRSPGRSRSPPGAVSRSRTTRTSSRPRPAQARRIARVCASTSDLSAPVGVGGDRYVADARGRHARASRSPTPPSSRRHARRSLWARRLRIRFGR